MNLNIQEADNHCHLISCYYGSISNILNIIKDLELNSNLEYIINMGLDYKTNREILEIKKKYNALKTTKKKNFLKIGLGFHPERIVNLGLSSIEEFKKIIKLIIHNYKKIDYIGEIGLDFSYQSTDNIKKLQINIFKDFCILAKELNIPMSIHSRKAIQDTIYILQDIKFETNKFNGYLHSFTGNFNEGKQLISSGFKLGINGLVTYDYNHRLRDDLVMIINHYSINNINNIIGLETDSPYLIPAHHKQKQDKINSPKNIKFIKEFIINMIQTYK